MAQNKELDRFYLYCLYLLKRRDYSETELRRKGALKKYEQEVIDEIITKLQSQKYQSDERCAESIWHQYKDIRGPVWIKQKFMLKGIDTKYLAPLLVDQPKDYSKLKTIVMQKYKLDSFQNMDPKMYGKVGRFILSRGYSLEALSQWRSED
jgi:regulatory protein